MRNQPLVTENHREEKKKRKEENNRYRLSNGNAKVYKNPTNEKSRNGLQKM